MIGLKLLYDSYSQYAYSLRTEIHHRSQPKILNCISCHFHFKEMVKTFENKQQDTCVQVQVSPCAFNTCKTSQSGVCMHCCTWFWHVHMGQWIHSTMKLACHKLTLGLPHYICGVTIVAVVVGNKIQLRWSWLTSLYCIYHLKILLKRHGLTNMLGYPCVINVRIRSEYCTVQK